jgi:hypothetical protein
MPQRIVEQALTIARGGHLTASDGRALRLQANTLCVHGDNASSVAAVQRIREALKRAGRLMNPRVEVVALDCLMLRLFDEIAEANMPWMLAASERLRRRVRRATDRSGAVLHDADGALRL